MVPAHKPAGQKQFHARAVAADDTVPLPGHREVGVITVLLRPDVQPLRTTSNTTDSHADDPAPDGPTSRCLPGQIRHQACHRVRARRPPDLRPAHPRTTRHRPRPTNPDHHRRAADQPNRHGMVVWLHTPGYRGHINIKMVLDHHGLTPRPPRNLASTTPVSPAAATTQLWSKPRASGSSPVIGTPTTATAFWPAPPPNAMPRCAAWPATNRPIGTRTCPEDFTSRDEDTAPIRHRASPGTRKR